MVMIYLLDDNNKIQNNSNGSSPKINIIILLYFSLITLEGISGRSALEQAKLYCLSFPMFF